MALAVVGSCEVCGGPRTYGRNRFCSMKCRDVVSKRPGYHSFSQRTCPVCDKQFSGRLGAKYCSTSCRGQGIKLTVRGFLLHLLKHRGRYKVISVDQMFALYERQGGLCAVTLQPMTISIGQGRQGTNISIDRIDSTKGYDLDNVQLVCLAVNLMKLDMKTHEFVSWCKHVIAGPMGDCANG